MTSPGPWRSFLNRSVKTALTNTNRGGYCVFATCQKRGLALNTPNFLALGELSVAALDGVTEHGAPRLLFRYRTPSDLKQHVTGCDADIGGKSSVNLDLAPDGRARFWGDMRLDVPAGKEESMRSGYAGFRSRIRTHLFGHATDDLSLYNYLSLRVRASGEPRTRSTYFVNIQTDGPVPSDIWQHRLYLNEASDGQSWEDVLIPLGSFVLTSGGETATAQVRMAKNKVRTVGISMLGGNARVSGRYELGVDYIGAVVNPEDADALRTIVEDLEGRAEV